ncbi:hypothetical protein AMTR_s00012p00233870 [Amborella trichopoda]|uniref:rhomboid protease n=2 Tax=Amborella trichopoda TaxID=13333 RepID=W1PIT0_AMBTC|nr:hypothetical protein AMTR_s00012p00233870 [Amborella trichopoda]
MGGEAPNSDVSIKISGRGGDNGVHPLRFSDEKSAMAYSRDAEERRRWVSWLVPLFVAVNVAVFVVVMFVNDCPKHSDRCIATFLGRFSFQPFKENPLLGPSSST